MGRIKAQIKLPKVQLYMMLHDLYLRRNVAMQDKQITLPIATVK